MALNIPEFENKFRLIDIRKDSLNPVIRATKALDVKVEGLQKVVAVSMTNPYVDAADKKIYFNRGGEEDKFLDLGPMLDTMKHGIDITTAGGGGYTDVTKIRFRDAHLNKIDDYVEIDFNPVDGQVNAGVAKPLKKVFLTGNTTGSSMTADGIMTINMPSNSISAKVNGNGFSNVDKVAIVDTKGSSEVIRDTLVVKIPDPIQGSIVGGTPVDMKSIQFIGNTGDSRENDGEMVIVLPTFSGDADGTGEENIKGIVLTGNRGSSKIENEILTIDLPTGGGGGGTANPLKVGEYHKTPIENVEEIYFEGSEVKTAVTKAGAKVLVTPRGAPVEIVDKDGNKETGNVKLIQLTGDTETSSISTTGQLTINIPHHAGLSVSDGSVVSNGINTIEFVDATVDIDSSAAAKATVTPKGISGKLGSNTGTVKEIEVTGTLGASSFANGKLKIDLPAGGGGTGGADITGIVGSDSAKIERIEIIGENKYNSKVDATTKTLTIDTPRKVSIKGGADVFSDVDIVEVANSTVQLDTAGGKRKAFITPHIPFMAEGWFPTMDALNAYIPQGARIPTKTYGFVPDPVTRENVLWIWLPNLTTGVNDWVAMPVAGSLYETTRGTKVRSIYGVERNPMVDIAPDGVVTIKDTTVPEVICETLNQDGTAPVKKGKFNELRFEDGEGVVNFDVDALDLKIFRAQRRFGMGDSATIEASSYTGEEYEGSIWLNKTDNSWWGYNNKDETGGNTKWTKIIHRGMSGEVSNLSKRLPQILPSLNVATESGDDKAWAESGWTHLPKDSVALPADIRNKTGGYIETFVIWDPTVTGFHHRYQMVHVETDAATYKRYWLFDDKKWSAWVKTSFNPLELKQHNEDPQAHRLHNPFFRAFSFGAKYPDFAGAIKGSLKYIVEKQECRLIGTSGGRYNMDPGGDYIKIPYDGKFTVRGLAYIGGKSDLGAKSIGGDWVVELQKCEAGSSVYNTISSKKYTHNSTTLKYPPFSFKFDFIQLERGDFLRLKIEFKPKSGTEQGFFNEFPDLWIMPGRSYFSIDEDGNDTGYAIAKGMCDMFGGFSPTGAGAFSYASGVWPNDKGNIVGDGLEDPVFCG